MSCPNDNFENRPLSRKPLPLGRIKLNFYFWDRKRVHNYATSGGITKSHTGHGNFDNQTVSWKLLPSFSLSDSITLLYQNWHPYLEFACEFCLLDWFAFLILFSSGHCSVNTSQDRLFEEWWTLAKKWGREGGREWSEVKWVNECVSESVCVWVRVRSEWVPK